MSILSFNYSPFDRNLNCYQLFNITHNVEIKKKTLCVYLCTPEQIFLQEYSLQWDFWIKEKAHRQFHNTTDIAKYISHQKHHSNLHSHQHGSCLHPWQYWVFIVTSVPTWWAGYHLVILFPASLSQDSRLTLCLTATGTSSHHLFVCFPNCYLFFSYWSVSSFHIMSFNPLPAMVSQ